MLTDAGLACTADPAKVRAGQATLFPTTITYSTASREDFTLDLEVYVIANNRDSQLVVMDTLHAALTTVRTIFDAPSAEAVTFELPGSVQVPGLRIPLTLHITKE